MQVPHSLITSMCPQFSDDIFLLEISALHTMKTFGSQGIANTLHIRAKKSYKPSETFLLTLERRAEVISGEFNSQSVANTLWAYSTMGRKPGERVMGLLEGLVERYQGSSTRRLLQTRCGPTPFPS